MKTIILKLILLFVVLTSCKKDEGGPDFFNIQGEKGFVGKVDGINAFVAVLVGQSEGIAYVCNGDEELSVWFSGAVSNPKSIFFSGSGGNSLSATFTDSYFSGTVVIGGVSYSFKAHSGSNSDAGMFKVIDDEADIDGAKAGWIVNHEGGEKGAFTVGGVYQTTPTFPASGFLTYDAKSYQISYFTYTPSAPSPVPIPYPNTGKGSD